MNVLKWVALAYVCGICIDLMNGWFGNVYGPSCIYLFRCALMI